MTGTISPWYATRPDYGVVLNHPTGITARHFDHDIFVAGFNGAPFDTNNLKHYLGNFPVFNCSSDPRLHLFQYLSSVVSYCAAHNVFLPPAHTLCPGDILGCWFDDLNPYVCLAAQNSFGGYLSLAFKQKHVGLKSHDSLRDLILPHDDGYLIYYNLNVYTRHPLLQQYPSTPTEPTQPSDISLVTYLSRWRHYMHLLALDGYHLSDRYFMQQFIGNMDSRLRLTIGRQLEHEALRTRPVGHPLPQSFSPDFLGTKLAQVANYLRRESAYLQTPRDLFRSSTAAMNQVTVDAVLNQLQSGSTDRPRVCFFCRSATCNLRNCPKAKEAQADPLARRTLQRFFAINNLDLGLDAPDDDAASLSPPPDYSPSDPESSESPPDATAPDDEQRTDDNSASDFPSARH